MPIFIVRLLSSIAFYICVAISDQHQAIASMVLIAGYRSLLVFSPLFSKLARNNDILYLLITAIVGIAFYLIFNLTILGALLIGFGLSVSGFIIKSIAAETAAGSATNKIAITAGNIGAGLIILFMHNNQSISMIMAILLLTIACFIPIRRTIQLPTIQPLTLSVIIENKVPYLIWFFWGTAIGIRVFGMYIIMPYYIVDKLGALPDWYGLTLVFYGIIVVITQFHAISKKFSISLQLSIAALSLSCIIMSVPHLFKIETFMGAIVWIFCLALEEIFAPYIDFHAAKSNNLLVKEVSIGAGGAICVLFTQVFSKMEFLGLISILSIAIGLLLYQRLLMRNKILENS